MTNDPEPARPDEWPAAFHLLFQQVPDERAARVANALALLERGDMNPEGVFVLRESGTLVGVLTCLPLPGALALLWPPQCMSGPKQADWDDQLLTHAERWLRGRGVKLAQTLLPTDSRAGTDALERHGFAYLTQLWYLRHFLEVPLHCLGTPVRLQFATVEEDPESFAATLIRSYTGTLDFPEINDVRTVPEILAGHRSQGVFDPGRWWLATCAGRPIGVMLAALTPETNEWDVAYIGIVPEARRQGFGREMMLRVLCEARAADVPAVTLAVDARNHPARHLYHDLGFTPFDRRDVYLAIWR